MKMKVRYGLVGIGLCVMGLCSSLCPSLCPSVYAQSGYWQQRANYEMEVELNTKTHVFTGKQTLSYTNNSPDTLYRVFYHLYYNAFQPGSMMDVRSRSIADPDARVRDRIFHLRDDETGYQKVLSLTQDGKALAYTVEGTVLEVALARPIGPGAGSVFAMAFEGRVPVQIRRAGRHNREGIAYSMSQWYPKMAEYDLHGWHAHPYVGREFHGVWGDFDVKIRIDKAYTVAGTGYLENAEEIGKGYAPPPAKKNRKATHTWHFKAPNVHDFMWAADPEYVHDIVQVPGGPVLHFFYQPDTLTENWKKLQDYTVRAFQFVSERYGRYPYEQFSVIQGGDGGMEYPMSTLITGYRSLHGLVGVTVHELVHSWYQGVLATNESLYAWVDEGFTTYASELTMNELFKEEKNTEAALFGRHYANYFRVQASGREEPMNTHADHFQTNLGYWMASYVKGAIFQHQLSYIVGEKTLTRALRQYFEAWKFKHPDPRDYIRVVERVSGLELDWYLDYFANTTHTIDYGIKQVTAVDERSTEVVLERVGPMPMPIVLQLEDSQGEKTLYYIPLTLMRGERQEWERDMQPYTLKDWPWTHREYRFVIARPLAEVASLRIDPSGRMADIEESNQQYPFLEEEE